MEGGQRVLRNTCGECEETYAGRRAARMLEAMGETAVRSRTGDLHRSAPLHRLAPRAAAALAVVAGWHRGRRSSGAELPDRGAARAPSRSRCGAALVAARIHVARFCHV